MGIFDGVSLKGIIRDFTNVAGAITGAGTAPQGDYTIFQPQETTQSGNGIEGGTYQNIFSEALQYGLQVGERSAQLLAQEQKESGAMENGPQVYTGSMGSLITQGATALGRTIFGGGLGGAVVGGVGGALIQQGVQQYMGAGDACGCGPKPFVRLDKCGRPIITRAMQSKAKDLVMCMGIENAAAALGISVPLLAEIAFKKFKPRARGISGAQLKTATRVNNKVMHMAKKLEASCKRPAARRR
tara:strand:+ start:288 stop:1016 length:729 start_codon:yes stop_codon:yes gene_type:complete